MSTRGEDARVIYGACALRVLSCSLTGGGGGERIPRLAVKVTQGYLELGSNGYRCETSGTTPTGYTLARSVTARARGASHDATGGMTPSTNCTCQAVSGWRWRDVSMALYDTAGTPFEPQSVVYRVE